MNMSDYCRKAAEMDERVRQLRAQGIDGHFMVGRMVGYLPDLQRIWVGASVQELAELCKAYPGFYQYASLMEDAAEHERVNPSPASRDLPELPAPQKQVLSTLLKQASILELGYQVVLDAGPAADSERRLQELRQLHAEWFDASMRFLAGLRDVHTPQAVLEIMISSLGQMADRIALLKIRVLRQSAG